MKKSFFKRAICFIVFIVVISTLIPITAFVASANYNPYGYVQPTTEKPKKQDNDNSALFGLFIVLGTLGVLAYFISKAIKLSKRNANNVHRSQIHKILTVNGTPIGIVLREGELPVRTYFCSHLKFPSCQGYLSVTNLRVLFHGYGGNSRIVDEVPLDAVSGISTFYGGNILFVRVIMGLVLLIAGFLLMNMNSYWTMAAGSIVIVSGFVVISTAYRKAFILKIYSSKASATPIHIGEGGNGGIVNNSALFAVTATPTDETDKMMLELGAMISDLQTGGDLAVTKWQDDEYVQEYDDEDDD